MEGWLEPTNIKFNSYMQFQKDDKQSDVFEKSQGVMISVQQLYHLQKNYDIMILDEIEVTLASFDGLASTHSYRGESHVLENFLALKRLIKGAKKVIVMDALVSHTTMDFLKALDKETDHKAVSRQLKLSFDPADNQPKTSNFEVIATSVKPQGRKFMIHKDRVNWWPTFSRLCISGRKCLSSSHVRPENKV
jgi:hypothetical protein